MLYYIIDVDLIIEEFQKFIGPLACLFLFLVFILMFVKIYILIMLFISLCHV